MGDYLHDYMYSYSRLTYLFLQNFLNGLDHFFKLRAGDKKLVLFF